MRYACTGRAQRPSAAAARISTTHGPARIPIFGRRPGDRTARDRRGKRAYEQHERYGHARKTPTRACADVFSTEPRPDRLRAYVKLALQSSRDLPRSFRRVLL